MRFIDFIKEKSLTIFLILFGIISIEIFLIIYPFGNFIKIYIPVSIFILYFIGISIEYIIKKNFYSNFCSTLNELDEKYLITEIIKSPDFIEGKLLKNSLEQINTSMIEQVNKYKYMRRRL